MTSRRDETSSPDRLAQVERIFQQARRLTVAARETYLDDVCASDSALRDEVCSLLDQIDSDSGTFLSEAALGGPLDLEAFSAVQEAPAVTSRLGNYRILRKLGEGGMGVVYLAEQEATNRRVALKVIHSFTHSPMLLRRFEQEARALGRLRHPGIAQVYEAGVQETEQGRTPFIAMELVEGLPVTEFATLHELSLNHRLELMIRVCDAVHHAHQHGVIHRDLKPANILVEVDGPKPKDGHPWTFQPKILDFGIARLTSGPPGTPGTDADHTAITMQTRTGQLIGTLPYMSPEQAGGGPRNGASSIDARSDVYALGVVLYELITGRLPLDLRQVMIHEAVRIIRDDDPPPLSSVDRRYRGDLTTIVGKALEKEPQRRYQSAAELAAELSRYLHDEPIIAHRPSAMYQVRKFARRNRALVASTITIAAVLIVATVVATRQAVIATAAQQRAEESQERAEEHFADAHQLARAMLFEIDDALVNVTGALPARRMLVERGLSYLDKIAASDGHDPRLLWEVAVGYVLIGDVQGDTQRPNIGDADGALASYRRAAELIERHQDEMPTRARATLFLALNKIGDQLAARGDLSGAAEQYQRALDMALEEGNRIDEATARARLADVLGPLGRRDEARRHRDAADAIERALMEEDPDDAGRRRSFAVTLFKRGISRLGSDPAAALEAFAEYTSICEDLAAAEQHNAVYQRDVAIGVQRMGHALEALGRAEEALPLYQRELAIMEDLAAADPENEQARAGMVAPCCKIGEAYLARGDLETSLRYFQRYLDLARACAERSPSDAAIQREVGVTYYKMKQWHALQGEDESLAVNERLAHWREARQWLVRCRDHFIAMGDAGTLAPGDAGVPDVIAAEIASCDETISLLEG